MPSGEEETCTKENFLAKNRKRIYLGDGRGWFGGYSIKLVSRRAGSEACRRVPGVGEIGPRKIEGDSNSSETSRENLNKEEKQEIKPERAPGPLKNRERAHLRRQRRSHNWRKNETRRGKDPPVQRELRNTCSFAMKSRDEKRDQ